jgi:hypothetical protein
MNLLEAFIEFIDSIYYEGYAKEMAESDPVKFTWEYNEFVGQLN